MDIKASIKIAELVEQDFQILIILDRLGIRGDFGDRSVQEVCQQNGLDTDTFILLCNVILDHKFTPSERDIHYGKVKDIIRYLHLSHEYYLNTAFNQLSEAIRSLIEPCSDKQKKIFLGFFTDYKEELDKHFAFEEGSVLPYIEEMLEKPHGDLDILENIEEDDCMIDEKLSDLKSLVLKSLPNGCDGRKRMDVLKSICELQKDLERHSCVEDMLLVPMIRHMESRRCGEKDTCLEKGNDKEVLSEREKEILVGVATGLINKEIADKYNISIHTVITHRKNITAKTGIKTVAGLTVYALLNGLIDINSVE